jgi:formylglycine-generating enzyme required for sulfatase activity
MRNKTFLFFYIGIVLIIFTIFTDGAQWPDLSKPPATIGGGENDFALIAAAENYPFVSPVPGAKENALAWYDYLEKTRGIPTENIILLRDNEVTKEGLKEAAEKAAESTGKNGILWFIFIGHGVPDKDLNDGLLVGIDAQQTAQSLKQRGLPINTLMDEIIKTKAGKIVVIIDACFSGMGAQGTPIVKGLQPLVLTNLGIPKDPRLAVFTAAKGSEFAGPLPGENRPAFSYLTLGGLRGWADINQDGNLTADELYAYVNKAIMSTVRGRTQTPVLNGNRKMVLIKSPGEKGPDLSKMAKIETSEDSFAISKLPEIPKISKISSIEQFTSGLDFRNIDISAMEEYDKVVRLDEEDISPKEKIKAWTELSKISKFSEIAQKRAREWEVYIEEKKAAEEAMQLRIEARDNDWGKLSRLLKLKVISKTDKTRWSKMFVKAYGKDYNDNPYIFELIPFLPQGFLTKEEIAKIKQQQQQLKDMVFIPEGEFLMGSDYGDDDEKPVHKVYLDSYYIDKYEVTFEEYDKFCEETEREKPSDNGWGRGNRPVIAVTWYDAEAYCKWAGKRLPTEAEWEKAARAGSDSEYSFGDNKNELDKYFWCKENSEGKTHPVGEKKPNKFGIYDMHGNVWEWCSDWYDENYYKTSPYKNPKGPDTGTYKVFRGGSFNDDCFCTF